MSAAGGSQIRKNKKLNKINNIEKGMVSNSSLFKRESSFLY
jgi:hypothetical protein